jgi:hypothetical protein
MLENPHEFAFEAVHIIKSKLTDQLIDSIQYEKLDEWYEMSQLDAEIENWSEALLSLPFNWVLTIFTF